MAHVKYQVTCDLCGLPVKIYGFTLTSPQGVLKFCCAGCQSIYHLLNENESTPSNNNPIQKEEETKK